MAKPEKTTSDSQGGNPLHTDTPNASNPALATAASGWTYSRWGYAVARCLKQFRDHKLASVITLLALGVTLTLPVMMFFSQPTLLKLTNRSLQGESMTVFLKLEVDDKQGQSLALQWAARTQVREAEFISRQQALRELELDPEIRNAIEALGNNPLPAAIVIYPADGAQSARLMQELANSLQATPEVDSVQLDILWIQRLQALLALLTWIALLLAFFLTLTAFLVIVNMIRLELSRRRAELNVASLLGASKAFIFWPVLYAGALYGLLGGLLASLLAVLGLIAIQGATNRLFSLYDSSFSIIMPTASHFIIVAAIAITIGVAGAISSLYKSSQKLTHKYTGNS
ncbi:MAG: cell division protein FtsX [Granulosicoccus sp.]